MRRVLLGFALYLAEGGTRVRERTCRRVYNNLTRLRSSWVLRLHCVMRGRRLHARVSPAPKTRHTTPAQFGGMFADNW